jgi:hypothetical protein
MTTKRANQGNDDSDPLDREFDFSNGVQGFFAKRKSGGARVIFLEGELARAFNDDAEIEKALRAYLRERGRKTA